MGHVRKMAEMLRRGLMKPDSMIRSMKEPPVVPAGFLINEDKAIADLHYGADFGDHISMKKYGAGWRKNSRTFRRRKLPE